MTDSRSFGYIFGSPDCGHRFFGIKTDKAASQVVLAMRDLFQCVFELKKKEIELAKQHIQNRITAHEHQQVKNSILDHKKTPSSLLGEAKSLPKAEKSPETSANLVDLEQELSSIQRGITQMERITPNDDAPTKNPLEDDPFGDSFTSFAMSSSTPFNILPPPASSKRNQTKQNDDTMAELSSIMTKSSTPPIPPFPSAQKSTSKNNESWVITTTSSSSVFNDPEQTSNFNDDHSKSNRSFDDSNNSNLSATKTEIIDAFSDLDPLGTGRSKPYVDKKYFFQDLKNPPKRVLKDLSDQESIFDAHFSPLRRPTTGLSLEITASGGSVFESLKNIDPFEEEDFSKIVADQFEATVATKSVSPKSIILPDTKISSFAEEKPKNEDKKINEHESYHAAPLHVELPPESWGSSSFSDPKRLDRQGSDTSSRNVFSVDAFSKKLPKSNLFGQRNVKRDSNGINMRRLQESDSLSENEPELPPRPETGSHEPPPLPPKNHRDTYTESSDSRSRYSRPTTGSRYDYSSRFKSQSNDSPPLPLPSRKVNRTETSYSSTSRPFKKSNDEDDYLTPNPSQSNDIPTLLPPPQKKDPSKTRGARKSETDPKNLDAPTPPFSAKPHHDIPTSTAPILPDITLSQLLTLGIDDLAHKLNVPISKLNTMTIVELTKYLSEFIEKSKHPLPPPPETPNDSPVFKVSFDDASDATFVAKFDDNFGENDGDFGAQDNSFVANFDNFNQAPVSVIPTADRYAVFREIMDQEINTQQSYESIHQESVESNNSNSLEEAQESSFEFPKEFDSGFSPVDNHFKQTSPSTVQMTKIDTKITDAISGAKDRYAALRDIILVEDLFDKSAMPPLASISDSNLSDDVEDAEHVFDTPEVADNNSIDNVPTYSISWADAEAMPSEEMSEAQQHEDQKSLQIISTSNKDDFEIDEYMKKAISELSLDQRLSPNIQIKSPSFNAHKQTSPSPTQQLGKPMPMLNDMSTSPIPPTSRSPMSMDRKGSSPAIPEIAEEVEGEEEEERAVAAEAKETIALGDDLRGKQLNFPPPTKIFILYLTFF